MSRAYPQVCGLVEVAPRRTRCLPDAALNDGAAKAFGGSERLIFRHIPLGGETEIPPAKGEESLPAVTRMGPVI